MVVADVRFYCNSYGALPRAGNETAQIVPFVEQMPGQKKRQAPAEKLPAVGKQMFGPSLRGKH